MILRLEETSMQSWGQGGSFYSTILVNKVNMKTYMGTGKKLILTIYGK